MTSEAKIGSGASVARASWLLGCVEALPPPATGALLVGHRDHPSGILFVERGRVLWVAVGGMSRRLRDILKASSRIPLADADMDALYHRCRSLETPLGEALLSEGYVDPDRMRAAMKLHTAESLLALDVAQRHSAEWPLTWIGRQDRGYFPHWSFSATEMLAAVGATLVDPVVAEVASEHLADASRHAGTALSYVDTAGGEQVLIGEASGGLLLAESLDLVEWAEAALAGSSGGFSPLVAHSCARRAPQGGTVAWRYEGCGFTALCPSSESLNSLVHFVDNQGLPMVLSTSSPALRRIRERGSVLIPDRS